jgi:hypothetical protein
MRHAFLILAHDNGDQLAALVDRLAPAGSGDRVLVHIDARSALWRRTRGAFLAGNPCVEVIARPVAVRWGHSSTVAAVRLLLRLALAGGFDLAHLMSGSHWPVVSAAEIAATYDGSTCHIEALPGLQEDRMQRVWLDARWLERRGATRWRRLLAGGLRRLSKLLPARRSRPWGPWHKGETWWSLPRDACVAVLPELDRAIHSGRLIGTVNADEHVIPTIMASRFPERIGAERCFVRWDAASSSPETLTAADWPNVVASGAWFARKLSAEQDGFFLDYG